MFLMNVVNFKKIFLNLENQLQITQMQMDKMKQKYQELESAYQSSANKLEKLQKQALINDKKIQELLKRTELTNSSN